MGKIILLSIVALEQIKKGGPVTITSKEMTRFFMSMPQAVGLVIKVAEKMKGREIFILKMDSLRIIDLAEAMIEELAPVYGHDPKNIPIQVIGVRSGEKLYESLITEEEAQFVEDAGEMYILRPGMISPHFNEENYKSNICMKSYNSRDARLLTKEEIKLRLYKDNLI